MYRVTEMFAKCLGLALLAACTMALAADNHLLLTPGTSHRFDLPNGGHVEQAAWYGFAIMGDESDPLHLSNEDCNGTTEFDADGNTVQAGGFCTLADKDHEAVWVWWAIDGNEGTWGVYAGTGKYEGATGGGTWEWGKVWPDGKVDNIWRGEINLR